MRANQKYSKEEMYLAIELWKESSQNQAAYCKANKLSRNTFKYWINKYNKEKPKPHQKVKDNFVQLEVEKSVVPIEKPVDFNNISISYPNGTTVTCPVDISPAQLIALVKL